MARRRRWVVAGALIHYQAEGFARKSLSDDSEWPDQLTDEVLGNMELLMMFREASIETPKRRAFLMHMVMSTAAQAARGEGQ
jgi:hypothetical protein